MKLPFFLFIGLLVFTSTALHAQEEQLPIPENKSLSHDFDFLLGHWEINSKRRKVWLAGNDEWIKSTGKNKVWKQMNGMLVMDEMYATVRGQEHIGSTYRFYNPEKNEWSIYWASTAFPQLGLLYQVSGSFENGVGVFYGEEQFNDTQVKIRWKWENTSSPNPKWEQAYWDAKNEEWETNWMMELCRKK